MAPARRLEMVKSHVKVGMKGFQTALTDSGLCQAMHDMIQQEKEAELLAARVLASRSTRANTKLELSIELSPSLAQVRSSSTSSPSCTPSGRARTRTGQKPQCAEKFTFVLHSSICAHSPPELYSAKICRRSPCSGLQHGRHGRMRRAWTLQSHV